MRSAPRHSLLPLIFFAAAACSSGGRNGYDPASEGAGTETTGGTSSSGTTGDAVLDSSVLIDNFRWAEGKVTTETERPK